MKRMRLAAIRLVGFHNFQDVFLRLKGDVFLIGANESGKTTVLDAIQLVLSAERNFVWNAGANPVGRRDEGRSLKGIVLRSDLSGNPRMECGIAWAGLEFRPVGEDSGQPMTLLFGASVKTPDSSPLRFGAQLKNALEDLALTERDDQDGLRVLRRDEVASRHGVEISGRSGDYIGDLEALFGGPDHFARVTTLWQLAKSYKELAVKTRKLSDLFVEFLQPPDPEAFQQVRKGLHDARDIEVKLDQLRVGRDHLRGLADQLTKLNAERESVLRFEYMHVRQELRSTEKQIEHRQLEIGGEEEQLKGCAQQRALLELEKRDAVSELEVLRSSEAMGLIERLRLAESAARQQERQYNGQQLRTAQQRELTGTIAQELDGLEEALIRQTADLRANLRSLAPHFSGKSEAAGLLLSLLARLGEQPIPGSMESVLDAGEQFGGEMRELDDHLAEEQRVRRQEFAEVETNVAALAWQRDQLRQHDEVLPPVEGYGALLGRLKEEGLSVSPLYRLLEPAVGVDDSRLANVEEFLGIEFLATLVAIPDHVARVREMADLICPGVRVLDALVAGGRSMPVCLCAADDRVAAHTAALWHDLSVSQQGKREGSMGLAITEGGGAFREGARSQLTNAAASFIGDAARARRRQQESARLEAELAACSARRDEIVREQNRIGPLRTACANAQKLVSGIRSLSAEVDKRLEKRRLLEQQQESLRQEEHGLGEYLALRESAAADERLLREQVGSSDAARAEARIKALQQEIALHDKELAEVHSKDAVSKDRIGQARAALSVLEYQRSYRALAHAHAREALFAALEPAPSDLDDYVDRTKQGQRGDLSTLPTRLRDAQEHVARLDTLLRGSDGIGRPELAAAYRFRIEDGPRTGVLTHDGKSLSGVLEDRERDVTEWSDRRTQRLREVFESLLEKELVGRLVADRRCLRERLDRLNRRLETVTFGGNRYRIRQSVKPESKWLEENLREQGLLAESARRNLRESIENRPELLGGAEDAVPEALDYRHWYDFDFSVIRSGQHEAHSADLSRGSGGAQASYNYLLLFCLAANFFDECKSPIRLLAMDEAFHNLDDDRRQRLLLAAKELDLDLVVATPNVDGTVLGTQYDSTTVLVEKDEADNVTLIPLVIAREESDLFAEPRAEPIIRSEPAP